MYHIRTKRVEIKSILGSQVSTGDPSHSHYTRLFMLSGLDMLVTIPFNAWYFASWFPVVSWPGWNFVHRYRSQVVQITTAELKSTPKYFYQLEVIRWMNVAFGLVFFVFFGVSAEARKHYADAWRYVLKTFFWQPGSSQESGYVLGIVLYHPLSAS
jgi:Pheromone A receptor